MTDPHQQAANIQAAFTRSVEAVRSDRNLSPQGKRAKLAQMTLERNKTLATLQQQMRAAQEQRERTLGGMLFSVPRDSQREYHDYAQWSAKLEKPEEFVNAMNRAERNGNNLLLQALAEAAYDRGYPQLTRTFFGTKGIERSYDEWHSMQPGVQGTIDPLHARMNDSALFQPSKPDELTGTSDRELHELAGEPMQDAA